jgi:pimeloyl-ACP methyl ester carboxylesterase
MFVPTSDAALVEEVKTAMSATPPRVGIGALEEMLQYRSIVQDRLQEANVPKVTINSADRPETNMEAAQRCGIRVVLMSGVGHFVMLEDPPTFNRLLDEAVGRLARPGTPK